ncbi:MAG TPA: hypothetical protein VK186_14475 [Candidatus Deferrimicrobium sp.]|nr:hypothetical protein [Candidatus Deferrimicrobium sp.]
MGLFVLLYFNFNGVEPHQWENVYNESKTLLDRFPIDLIRYKPEIKYGHKRGVFTTDLVANPGQDDEFWRVDGDLVSGRTAETFMLSKREYDREKNNKLPPTDILWAEDNEIDYIDANGFPLFNSKTQGYPYHLAMLAVGMLFESRFPKNAYVTGDIDRWQVDVILKWAAQVKILSRPLVKPVCVDASRLWDRLDALFPDKKLLFKRFKAIFRGGSEEMLETILKNDKAGVSRDYFFEELNRWDTLSKLGAIQLIIQWLNTTHDMESLIRYTCYPPVKENEEPKPGAGAGGKFKLEDLLEVVCHTFINIPMAERDPLMLFSMKEDRLHTISDLFSQTFMTMGGAPRDVNYYLSPAELFDIVCRFEPDPEKRAHLQEIIENSEKENREFLEKLKAQLEEAMKNPESPESECKTPLAPGETIDQSADKEEDMEKVIIDSALSQQIKAADPEKLAQSLGDSLKDFAERNKDALAKFLNSTDREFLLARIVEASFEEGFALVEEAWKNIDSEENLSILKGILCLTLIHNSEMNFWRLRIYILQDKQLWKFIALDAPANK